MLWGPWNHCAARATAAILVEINSQRSDGLYRCCSWSNGAPCCLWTLLSRRIVSARSGQMDSGFSNKAAAVTSFKALQASATLRACVAFATSWMSLLPNWCLVQGQPRLLHAWRSQTTTKSSLQCVAHWNRFLWPAPRQTAHRLIGRAVSFAWLGMTLWTLQMDKEAQTLAQTWLTQRTVVWLDVLHQVSMVLHYWTSTSSSAQMYPWQIFWWFQLKQW